MANTNDVVIGFTAIGDDQVVNAINSVTTHVEKQKKAVDRMGATYRKAANDSNVYRKSQRQMSGMMGQMGHQVQDISVQLQSGTNAMIVFGQQGSQIASVMGAKGAMFGALIAIGAAIYTYVEKASVEASKKLREFEGELAKTATTGKTFDDSLRNTAIVEVSNQLTVLKNSQEQLTEKQADAANFLERYNKHLEIHKARQKQLTMGLPEFSLGVSYLADTFYFSAGAVQEAEQTLSVFSETAVANAKQMKILADQLAALGAGSDDPFGYHIEQANKFGEKIDELTLKYGKGEIALLRLRATELTQDPIVLATLNAKIDAYEKYKKTVDEAAKAESDKGKGLSKGISNEQRFVDSLTTQSQTMGLSKAATMAYKASLLDLSDTQQLVVLDALNQIAAQEKLDEQIKKQEEATKSKAKGITGTVNDFIGLQDGFKTEQDLIVQAEESKLKILDDMYKIRGEKDQQYYDLRSKIQTEADNALADAERQKQMTVAGAMNSQLQQLASFFDESSAIGKAAFVANQGMAIANAIISAEEASAKALALYPSMPAYAGMIKAMGYASAGAIAGQTIASFEGGGITFSGVRSGGVDGKGGRMAVVHPNEKITDLEKGGSTGGAVNVSFNINAVDATGIDKLLYERRGMITSMVQKAVNNHGKRIM